MSVLFLLLLASTLQFYPLVCLFERVSCIPVLSEQASEVTRGTVRHTIKASLCELCVSLFLSEIDRKLQDTRWHFRTPPFLFSSEQQSRGEGGLKDWWWILHVQCPVLRSLFAFWISSRVYCRREQNTWILNRLNSSRFNYWLIVPWLCGSILAVIESITHQIICPLLSNLWFILFYFISFPPRTGGTGVYFLDIDRLSVVRMTLTSIYIMGLDSKPEGWTTDGNLLCE